MEDLLCANISGISEIFDGKTIKEPIALSDIFILKTLDNTMNRPTGKIQILVKQDQSFFSLSTRKQWDKYTYYCTFHFRQK